MLKSCAYKALQAIGAVLWVVKPLRDYAIGRWVVAEKPSILEKQIHRYFNYVYYKLNETEQGELVGLLWNETTAEKYAQDYQGRPWGKEHFEAHPRQLNYWGPAWDFLEKHLQSSSKQLVMQLGTASGREIAYFAKKFPQHEFIGTDLSSKATQRCNDFWKEIRNLRFEPLDARDISKFGKRPDVCISSATICLLSMSQLETFFKQMAAHWPGALMLIDEPLGGWTPPYGKGPRGYSMKVYQESLPRGAANWSHNYASLAWRLGFQVLLAEEHSICSHEYLVTSNSVNHAFLRRAHVVFRLEGGA